MAFYFVMGHSAAQAQRGETGHEDYGDVNALWIFVLVAIYGAFKQSKRTGFQFLTAFAALGLVWVLSPTIGSAVFAAIGLVFVIALFWSYL